ncbi:MAG: hypothetical protein ACI8TE_001181 [Francisella sp.]|jgi:hypothetical protein
MFFFNKHNDKAMKKKIISLAMIVGVEALVGCVNESGQRHDLLN